MTDQVDMNLPESFHRLKRTVLLLSAALFVLGLAEPASTRELHSEFLNLTLSTVLIQWLLFGATAYYVWGFWLEVQVARRLNIGALAGVGMAQFDANMGALSSDLRVQGDGLVNRLNGHATNLARLTHDPSSDIKSFLESVADKLDVTKLSEVIARDVSQLVSSQAAKGSPAFRVSPSEDQLRPVVQAALGRTFSDSLPGQFEKVLDPLRADLRSVPDLISETANLAEAQRRLAQLIDALNSQVRKLNPQIIGHRKTSFWLWECGGAFTAFAAAAFVNIPWSAIGRTFASLPQA